MRRKAFLWSTSTLYIGIVLLLLSNQNGAMINLFSDTASNRMASDRLQLAAYNVLLDLNRYLSRTTTEQIYLLTQEGQPITGLESRIRTDYWTERMGAYLKQDEVEATIVITNLEIVRHQSPRDLVQMSSLSLPAAHALFEGAVDINCDLSVTLKLSKPYASTHSSFKIRTLSPARIFGLLEQTEKLNELMQKELHDWPDGDQSQTVAERVASRLTESVERFYLSATKAGYSGRTRFSIDVTRSSTHRFDVQLKLEGSNITDLSEFSYALVDAKPRRIALTRDMTFSTNYIAPTDAGGPDRAQVEGTILSPA